MNKKKNLLISAVFLILIILAIILTIYRTANKKIDFEQIFKISMISFTTSDNQTFYYLDTDGITFYKIDKKNQKPIKIIQKQGDKIDKVIWNDHGGVTAIAQSQTPDNDINFWLIDITNQKFHQLDSKLLDVKFETEDTILTLANTDNNYHLLLSKISSPLIPIKDYNLKNQKCDTIVDYSVKNNSLTCFVDLTDIAASIKTIDINNLNSKVFEGDYSSAKVSPDGKKMIALKNLTEDESEWALLDSAGVIIKEIPLPTYFYDISKTTWSTDSEFVISVIRHKDSITDTIYSINSSDGMTKIIDIGKKLSAVNIQHLMLSSDNKTLYFISNNNLYRKSL